MQLSLYIMSSKLYIRSIKQYFTISNFAKDRSYGDAKSEKF